MNAKTIRALLVISAMLIVPLALFAASAPQVKTKSGVVEGKEDGAVRAFLGIPYAVPPVGDLRWKPPVTAAKWTGVRKATDFGPHCLQGNVFGDMTFRDPAGSEDCLSLNVWVPAKPPSAKLPVMVWIYGGGFVAGSTSETRQDGTNLAQQGVVVVSMNYRLGIFGFFVHPELAKESGHNAAGNYGLLDQVAALHWVHNNIAAFGGDPENVTIFGESAGSFSVSAQMASPLAKGLFQKAIGESGGAFYSGGLSFETRSVREEKDVQAVSAKLGVSKLADLRALPAEKLLDPFIPPQSRGFDFGPDVDGYFLPEPVPAIFAAGKQNDVPLLAGWNHDEGSFEIAFSPTRFIRPTAINKPHAQPRILPEIASSLSRPGSGWSPNPKPENIRSTAIASISARRPIRRPRNWERITRRKSNTYSASSTPKPESTGDRRTANSAPRCKNTGQTSRAAATPTAPTCRNGRRIPPLTDGP